MPTPGRSRASCRARCCAAWAQAGLFGLMYESEYGGAEADALTNLVFAEALSQSTFAGFIITVLVHTDMASPHLHHAGSAAQKDKYLRERDRRRADHRRRHHRAGRGLRRGRHPHARARRDGDDWVLNGTKMFITNGVHADLYFVAAKTGPGKREVSMFIVEKGTPGFTRRPRAEEDRLAVQSDTAELVLRQRAHPGRPTCWARRARASTR